MCCGFDTKIKRIQQFERLLHVRQGGRTLSFRHSCTSFTHTHPPIPRMSLSERELSTYTDVCGYGTSWPYDLTVTALSLLASGCRLADIADISRCPIGHPSGDRRPASRGDAGRRAKSRLNCRNSLFRAIGSAVAESTQRVQLGHPLRFRESWGWPARIGGEP